MSSVIENCEIFANLGANLSYMEKDDIMKSTYSKAILASYATFRELYNEGKYHSPYQILGEFVKYIVVTEHNYSFSLFDMKNHLNRVFGFELPTAVIRTAIKGIEGIKKEESSSCYVVDEKRIEENAEFCELRKEAEEENTKLSGLLVNFARKRMLDQYIGEQELVQDFIAFLIDELSDTKYHDLISEFILTYKDDQEVKHSIDSVLQGAVLYTGLNYNISETGSLKKDLALYLDTEILFDLAGYNGEIYRSIAEDLVTLVKDANRGEKKIRLYYFKEVYEEIDRFFSTAVAIVNGKELLINKPAMKAICNGCGSGADVIEKQADLFSELKAKYGIYEDPFTAYYSKTLNPYNLEGVKFEDIPDDSDSHDALRYISHINKLRKGQQFQEYTESEFLFITETRRALDISKAVTADMLAEVDSDAMRICEFAQNMSGITNVLWYKLNKGFGRKDYPQNLDAVLKAKIVIAKHVSQNVANTYREIKQQFDNGGITKEVLATRMIALREKKERPEEISLDTLKEDLDFSSEYFNQYEITVEKNKSLLKEREGFIRNLQEQAEFERKISDNRIAQLEGTIKEQNNEQEQLRDKIDSQRKEMDAQNAIILELRQKERKREKQRQLIINWIKLIARFLFCILMLVAVVLGVKKICENMGWSFGTVVSIVIGLAGLVPIAIKIVKIDYENLITHVKDEMK